MKIIVLVKEVPDTYGDRKLSLETGIADRSASESVLDEIGERALEVALSYADTHAETEIVVLSMAPESAAATLRKGLAMGAASAVQVVDVRLAGADHGLTAEVLAAALRHTGFDLVIAGNLSTDGSGGVIPAMIAELLDIASATSLDSVDIESDSVSGVRATDGGTMTVAAQLPAIISITERLPDARFPNFKGIMAAKKKPFATLALADLAVDPDSVDVARSIIVGVAARPPRAAGITIIDEGNAGQQLAEYLIKNHLA